MMNNKQKWKTITTEEGTLLYEGFTLYNKPYGAGTLYFQNGSIFQEGVFGIKGLLCGREYYPNGKLRFEGLYELCKAYGPNYPKYGKCYDQAGNQYFSGELIVHAGGVGYPMVKFPKEFGAIPQEAHPRIEFFMWEDEKARTATLTDDDNAYKP